MSDEQEKPDQQNDGGGVLSQDDLDAILAQAGSLGDRDDEPEPLRSVETERTPQSMDLPDIESSAPPRTETLELLKDISVNVKIELGRTQMYIEDILKLGPGSVVELDKLAGDPVDILVNDRPIAKGEVLILNDNFCVRIGEVITPEERLNSKSI